VQFHLTPKSTNAKTGDIPVSTTSSDSCPPSCALRDACYGKGGPLAIHWRAVDDGKRGTDIAGFAALVATIAEGSLWRHDQAGDLPGEGDWIYGRDLRRIVRANEGRRGFTYTHKPMGRAERAAAGPGTATDIGAEGMRNNRRNVKSANARGFTINLSANNLAHADALSDLKIGPVVTVLPTKQSENTVTPAGRRVVVCPATQRDDVTCASCGLCQRQGSRPIIGFPAHGMSKRKASAIAEWGA
jgi:hypothetical protein